MTYKQVETSREVRLWITSIITPIVIGGVMIACNPELRGAIKNKFEDVKYRVTKKFKRL